MTVTILPQLRQVARRTAAPAAGAVPALVACVYLVVVLAAVVVPDRLAGASPSDIDPLGALRGPTPWHWFGTDELGRDVFARVVHAARPSMVIGFGATALGAGLGTVIGLAAAMAGRVLDGVLMRLVDLALAFPGMLLALLTITVLGPGTTGVLVAVGIGTVPEYARLVRSRAMVVRRAEYVEAATGLGVRRPVVVGAHVVPNTLYPLLVRVTLGVGSAILTAAGLGYLGLGPPPPAAEWGAMVADGQEYLALAWWTVAFPGAVLSATVVALTVLGRALRDLGPGGAA